MNYLKLFLPIPFAILLIVLTFLTFENQSDKVYVLICGILVKGGVLIYYLRIGNDKTPMINTLTVILLGMLTGEYLFNNELTGGQILFIITNIAFVIVYLIRQTLKDKKDKLASLKSIAVLVYGVTNIIYINGAMNMIPILIGNLLLTSVYLYDRLLKIDGLRKNYR
jgi:hypothetical protein